MKRAHLLLLIILNCFWAGCYAAFKTLAPYLDAGGISTLRFGLAAVLLLIAWPWLPGQAPVGRNLLRTFVMGIVVFVFAPRLQVAGVQHGQAGDAAVLMGLEPLVTSVAAAVFLRERIGPRRWLGFVLGLSGVLFMARFWRAEFQWPDLKANAFFVASFVCEAAYSIIGKSVIQHAGLAKVLALALASGTGVNLLFDGHSTLVAAQMLPLRAWLILAYLVLICTLAGYIGWYVVISETEVNVTVLTVFLQPVIGVVIAKVALGESLHWGQLWGAAAIVAGLVIALSRQIRLRKA